MKSEQIKTEYFFLKKDYLGVIFRLSLLNTSFSFTYQVQHLIICVIYHHIECVGHRRSLVFSQECACSILTSYPDLPRLA